VVWREYAGRSLADAEIAGLIRRRLLGPVDGLADPSGRVYSGRLELDAESRVVLHEIAPPPRG
jgi:hypothetical protein